MSHFTEAQLDELATAFGRFTMPARKPKKPWNAVVAAFDGKTYLIGRPAIEDDYASFLVSAEGIGLGHATEKARDSDLKFWVREHLIDIDWPRLGTLIERPTYEQLIGIQYLMRDRDAWFLTI